MEAIDVEAKDMNRKDKEVKDMSQVHLTPLSAVVDEVWGERAVLVATPWRGGCRPRSSAVGRAETGKRMT